MMRDLNPWIRLRDGDREAFQELVEAHMPLAKHMAARFAHLEPFDGIDHDDILAAATIGLIRAIRGFAPEKGTAFVTYAWTSIARNIFVERSILLHACRDRSLWVEKTEAAIARETQRLGRRLTEQERDDIIRSWQERLPPGRPTRQMNACCGLGYDIPSHDDLEAVDTSIEVRRLLSMVSGRDRAIVQAWVDGLNLEETGRMLGITRERVRQLRNRITERLKAQSAIMQHERRAKCRTTASGI